MGGACCGAARGAEVWGGRAQEEAEGVSSPRL